MATKIALKTSGASVTASTGVRYATRNGARPCVIYLDRGERRAVAVIDAESVDVGAMRAAVTGGTVIDLTGDFDTGHDGGS